MTELGLMQEKFEAWMENPLDLKKNADGKYLDLETCAYWITWQEAFEARSSLESERQAIMKSLSITFDSELGAEGQGYEAPAEPEPQYFETLAEAVEFEFKLVAGECDRLESENARLREGFKEAKEIIGRCPKVSSGVLGGQCQRLKGHKGSHSTREGMTTWIGPGDEPGEGEDLRGLVTEAEELFDLIGKFAGGDLTRIKVWREKARGAIRGGTNVSVRETS